MSVYGYVRVSTMRQANEGESLEVQQRQLEGYALMHALTIDEVVVEEGVSGSVPVMERPKGGKLFARLERGDIVIAAKLDRLFRFVLPPQLPQRKRAPASGTVRVSGSASTLTSAWWAQAWQVAVTERTPFKRMLARVIGYRPGPKYPSGH